MKNFYLIIVGGLLVFALSSCGTATVEPTETPEPVEPAETSEPVEPTETPEPLEPTETPDAADKELNFYGWSEYVPDSLLKAFEKETGISVNYTEFSSNEEMIAKLAVSRSLYDLIIPSDYAVQLLTDQNRLRKIEKSKLSNLSNIDPQFLNLYFDENNDYSIPYQAGSAGIVYDRSKVSLDFDTYMDLWDESLKNNLVMLDDSRTVIPIGLLLLGYDPNTTNPSEVREAGELLKGLVPNISVYDSDSPSSQLLSGQAIAGFVWNAEASLANLEDPNFEFTCPKEGCNLWQDNLAIPSDAKNVDAAHMMIDFILRPEQSALITYDYPYWTPNTGVNAIIQAEDPEYATFLATYRANAPTQSDYDTGWLGEPLPPAAEAVWEEVWTELKLN